MRSWLSARPAFAGLLALAVGVAGGLGLGAFVFSDEERRPPPTVTKPPARGANENGRRDSGGARQEGAAETGNEPPAPAPESAPQDRSRSDDQASPAQATTVPDELSGQSAAVSAEDLRLSGLRARIRGRGDPEATIVCGVEPAEGAVVEKGSTVTLATRC